MQTLLSRRRDPDEPEDPIRDAEFLHLDPEDSVVMKEAPLLPEEEAFLREIMGAFATGASGGLVLPSNAAAYPPAIRFAEQHGGALITNINETTRERTAEIIAQALRDKKDPLALQEDLMASDGPYGQGRANMIGRTESAFAAHVGQANEWRSQGFTHVKIFDGEDDEICAEANGSIWSIEDYLENPIGHPNCRRRASPIPPRDKRLKQTDAVSRPHAKEQERSAKMRERGFPDADGSVIPPRPVPPRPPVIAPAPRPVPPKPIVVPKPPAPAPAPPPPVVVAPEPLPITPVKRPRVPELPVLGEAKIVRSRYNPMIGISEIPKDLADQKAYIDWFEGDKQRAKATEQLLLASKDGKTIIALEGDAKSVTISTAERKKFRRLKNHIWSHNHPNGSMLSEGDLYCGAHWNSGEVRAFGYVEHSNRATNFSLRRMDRTWPPEEELIEAHKAARAATSKHYGWKWTRSFAETFAKEIAKLNKKNPRRRLSFTYQIDSQPWDK